MSTLSPLWLKLARKVSLWLSEGLIRLIKGYQKAISPALPLIFGSNCGCRFSPTCSHYAIEAIQNHGLVRGSGLATGRILKCTPFSAGGHDPVPDSRLSPKSIPLAKPSLL
jgi:uncharacterized protein